MALQSNAALLDELMGKHRNSAPGACINAVRFDDEDVCKYFLVNFCPHELFVNTRADLGPCTKIHDEEMKKKYEKSSRYGKLGYEEDFERFLRTLLSDVERKIRRGMERLKLTQTDSADKKTPIQLKEERVAFLKEQINKLIKEAETLGEQGDIEDAQSKLEESEKYKSECKYLENQLELAMHNSDQKQMEVCNVCGSFLIVNDAQSRVEEHVSGKQHKGYAQLRSALEDIRKKRIDEIEKRERERETREKERERERDRERRDRDRDRGDRRDRSRDRPRESRDRSRDRDRDRGRDENKHRSSETSSSKRRSSRSPSNRANSSSSSTPSSKRNGTNSRDMDRDKEKSSKERRASDHSSSSSSKRARSRSRSSRDRSKHLKKDEETKSSTNGKSMRDSKLDQQTDEFLKLVDNLTKPKRAANEEKEEGEVDDDNNGEYDKKSDSNSNSNMSDEGEIRG